MIKAVIATHHVVTLYDLEQNIILRLRDFAEVSSFENLGIGTLVRHEKVRNGVKIGMKVGKCALTFTQLRCWHFSAHRSASAAPRTPLR